MLIPGYATEDGTARFRQRLEARLPGHFRCVDGLWLSSIGIGTYLGEPNAQVDCSYSAAITRALQLGVNVIDSAVNYRHQRSERSIGRAISGLISSGELLRDEIFLATKGGFLTFDADPPADPASYFYEQIIQSGLARPEDVAADCHVMSPRYLKNQIEVSRQNLGMETIDLYYVHNPETQLSRVNHEEFYRRLQDAFAALEEAVSEGRIRFYGLATWNAFRTEPDSREAVSLKEVLRAAREVGGEDHHFRAVQLPFNLAMPEALLNSTQSFDGQRTSLLRCATMQKLMVFASATLLQGQLSEGFPPGIAGCFKGLKTDAQRSIQFVRSTPGITCALVGMSRLDHVEQNLATAATPPLSLEEYRSIFSRKM
jgi:aryl-alcohol dehydrogenase-like predicted oxidoreductase